MDSIALQACNLHFTYPDGTKGLQGLNLVVQTGSKWALMGPNGAGKTTFFLLADGLLQPASGELKVLTLNPSQQQGYLLRKKTGYVFQNPDDQVFCPTVLEELLFGPLNLGHSREQALEAVHRALHECGLEGYEQRVPQHLSGGEKRRVAIASVLAMEPELLFFDEPTAGLDPVSREELINLLSGMNQTLLIATHDFELALRVCDQTALLAQGRVCQTGATQAILSDKKILEENGLLQPSWLPYLIHQIRQGN